MYEDHKRTMEFMRQLVPYLPHMAEAGVRVRMLDASSESFVLNARGIHDVPDSDASSISRERRCCVFSRCSGSYLSRRHARSPFVIECMLECMDRSSCRVFNGVSAYRMEMNKAVAFIRLSQASRCEALVAPPTVAVGSLEGRVTQRAADELFRHPQDAQRRAAVYIKSVRGGGSTLVARVDVVSGRVDPESLRKARAKMELEPDHQREYIMQLECPSDARGIQFRFEIIGYKVYYVVRMDAVGLAHIQDDHDGVTNLCMCDIQDEGSEFLQLMVTPDEVAAHLMHLKNGRGGAIAAARTMFQEAEEFAKANDLFVVALEGTISCGKFYVFDINTNSNYNDALEKNESERRSFRVCGAHRVMECIVASPCAAPR